MDELISKEVMGGIQSAATSSILIELHVSLWGGRKIDKVITDKVKEDNNADKKKSSGSFHKYLLPNCAEFKALQDLVRKTKEQHNLITSPWTGNGQNIMPSKSRIAHCKFLDAQKFAFWNLVQQFRDVYPQRILDEKYSSTLANMFRDEDYPSVEDLFDGKGKKSSFGFEYNIQPVPTTDWRIELEESGREELNEQLNRVHNSRMANAMQGLWEKLRAPLETMSQRLTDKPAENYELEVMGETDAFGNTEESTVLKVNKPARAQGFHRTLLTNVSEIVDVLDDLNFTGDEKLSETSRAVRAMLSGTDYDSLKGSSRERMKTKEAVDNLLSKFEF